MTGRRPSSARWLAEHHADPHVLAARQEGYRSRAVYKLQEIQDRFHLLRPGLRVVDLGAAPGGWTQLAARLVAPQGRVVAVDLLPISPVAGQVITLQGDFLDDQVIQAIREALQGGKPHIILSDMAANLTGNRSLDRARGERLAQAVLDFAEQRLAPEGHLVIKLFQGEGFQEVVGRGRRMFRQVRLAKPEASRDRSPEQYLVGIGFLGSSTELPVSLAEEEDS